jgi:hypothetical protein
MSSNRLPSLLSDDVEDDDDDNNNNNSIPYYFRDELTATRPITDTAQCRYTQLHTGQTKHKVKD